MPRPSARLLALLLLIAHECRSEEFAGEPYLLGSSVATNGSSGALPSRMNTVTQYLDFPGDLGPARLFRLEMATLPAFASLSQAFNGALAYSLDANTQVIFYTGMVTTPDITMLPILPGTVEGRINDPRLRPSDCPECTVMKDVVYHANLNFMRKYSSFVPRTDISNRPIPIEFSVGATSKYYYEELEAGDYEAQNLNLDLGACVKFLWGYNPVTHLSDRDIKIQLGGFELLPTKQKSTFSQATVYEAMERRWHLSASWEEGLPAWGSTLALGVTQKSESGRWPSLGAEWDLRGLLCLRAGWDQEFLSAGSSLAYRWFSVHYAFRHHELGTSLYQVSAQVQWP